jgi:CheY-like chemotaxis protein
VEDDQDIREAVADILELEGFNVATATNGQEGLKRLDELGQQCLVLLDMMMPVLDGAGFLARLEADPVRRTLPVVVVTASDVPLPPGAKRMLRKPYESGALVALINELCPEG